MDETLKRRLVGVAVISLLVLIIAWWLPDRQDGQKRLNPETLPTETRVYDINQLGQQESPLTETETAEVGEAAPPPEFEADFGQLVEEDATVAEAASGQDAKPMEAESTDSAVVEDIETEAPAEPAIKPAPVTTQATQNGQSEEATTQTAKAEPAKVEPEPAAAAPKPAADGDWLVQVGSYSKQANAESMRKKIAAKGYRVFVTSAQVGGSSYHRVRVGPYPGKDDANAAAARLKQLLGQDVAVMAND